MLGNVQRGKSVYSLGRGVLGPAIYFSPRVLAGIQL